MLLRIVVFLFFLNCSLPTTCNHSFVLPVSSCANSKEESAVFKVPKVCFANLARFSVDVKVGKRPGTTALFLDTGSSLSYALLHKDFPAVSNYEPSGPFISELKEFNYSAHSMKFRFYKEPITIVDSDSDSTHPEHLTTTVSFGGVSKDDNPNLDSTTTGILGLSTVPAFESFENYIFLKKIYSNLNDKLFALWMSRSTKTGYFSVGQPLDSCYSQSSAIRLMTKNGENTENFGYPSWLVKGNLMLRYPDRHLSFWTDLEILFDTGFTGIGLTSNIAKGIEKKLGIVLDQTIGYPKYVKKLLPQLVFTFEGEKPDLEFPLTPDDYVTEGTMSRIDLIPTQFANRVILGFPFNFRYYTEYGIGDNKMDRSVLVAEAKSSCDP